MAFQRVLIANRGEIAVRIIRACRELGISPVAVYSEADAEALHVRLADVAVCVGPAPATRSYLRLEAIVEAARATGAEAIHPGYGFLSENAAFARRCRDAGIIFIGPPPEAIEAMGGKIGARRLAQEAGVPVVPGYDGPDQSDARLLAEATAIGYPLLIKASAGGGGKGMRIVHGPEGFQAALEGARREAQAAFGDDAVFLERLILRPRHVEIQVLADSHGTVLHLGERECSIQRRHQKILEESPSPALTAELRATMGAAAVRVARAAGYVNAGTVEFVLDPEGRFFFLEMNTRLQVEHPVTELVAGLDLVRWQIAIAAGARLSFGQEQVALRGHAIEARLYAEDPVSFLPAVGRLALLDPPLGPGVRVDSGLTTGDAVTVHYDPMIAKLIVYAESRLAAIERLRRALDDFAVLGLTTNLPLLRAIAAHPAYAAGDTTTAFLDEYRLAVAPPAGPPTEVLVAAAILEAQTSSSNGEDPFATRWRANGGALPVNLAAGPSTYRLSLRQAAEGWHVALEEDARVARVIAADPTALTLELGGGQERFRVARDSETNDLLIAWRGHAYRLSRPAPLSADSSARAGGGHDAASLTAPMPGTVVRLLVREGEEVHEGQALVVLEAMKMEHTVTAPYAGTVRRLPFAQGASVAGGATLVDLAPGAGDV
ncbi:MAG: acetyl-CoA carboxylase biotin carboxylase subunit [Chloroflexi bacterium OHK40]